MHIKYEARLAPSSSPARPWLVVAPCFAFNFIARGVGDTYMVFLLPLGAEFGWPRSHMTSVYSALMVLSGLAAPLAGLDARFFPGTGQAAIYGAVYTCPSIGSGLGAQLAGVLHDLTGGYRASSLPDRTFPVDSSPSAPRASPTMNPDTTHDDIATRLLAARAKRLTIAAISEGQALSLHDAYAVQARVTAARLARGERIVGWKLGYTSLAMRQQMGIAAPNFGPLTDAMRLGSGDSVSPTLIQPKVEPEIAVVLGRALEGAVSVADVAAAVSQVLSCLEVVDSVFTDYRFTLEDNTADGSSAAQVVLGSPLPVATDGLATVEVAFFHNGSPVGSATGAAASGDPLAGVAWLAAQLSATGRRLEAGDVVITGGLCRAVTLAPGDMVSARFGGEGGVEVSVRR
jgi:2-keto-4-pentenoate hydratase